MRLLFIDRFNLKYSSNSSFRIQVKAQSFLKNEYQNYVIKDAHPFPPKQLKKGENYYFLWPWHNLHARGITRFEVTYMFDLYIKKTPFSKNLTINQLPITAKKKYTFPTRYWPTKHPYILSVVAELKKQLQIKEAFVLTVVNAVWNFVNQRIKYREHLQERLGALRALKEQYGDCDEFTDLFITLLRAFNIPCRRITGYYIKNAHSVEPHAWAEVLFLDNEKNEVWIPFDAALNNWGYYNGRYLLKKIESTVAERHDVVYNIKSKNTVNAEIILLDPEIHVQNTSI